MIYIRYILLTILLFQLSLVVYRANLIVNQYVIADVNFQKKVKLEVSKIKEDNDKSSFKKIISILEISQMRSLEHGVILKLLDYLYFIFIISVLLIFTNIYDYYTKNPKKISRGQIT